MTLQPGVFVEARRKMKLLADVMNINLEQHEYISSVGHTDGHWTYGQTFGRTDPTTELQRRRYERIWGKFLPVDAILND